MAGNAKPDWLRRSVPDQVALERVKELMDSLQLHTVCEGAHCPNQGECFARGTATFMILGDVCTRNCTFCAVVHSRPGEPDAKEPGNLLEAVRVLGLRHVVVTSVTRDDLPDGGAGQFARVVSLIHGYDPDVSVEVLIPDFQGSAEALAMVVENHPDIINHNVETVPRLYPGVRPQANYNRSLEMLGRVKTMAVDILTKSGLMVGLGESREEVFRVMADLRGVDCDLLTIGQYLRPSPQHHDVVRFVNPAEFEEYREAGEAMGFRGVASAPYVRSSFRADRMLDGLR